MINLRNSYFSINDSVRETLSSDFTDHRSESFLRYIKNLEEFFCKSFNVKYCTFVQGSGTLANEIMIEEIWKKHEHNYGIVFNRGEFGRRLVDSCTLKGLDFNEFSESTSRLINYIKNRDISWILFPLCESSTGEVYDLHLIKEVCREWGVDIYIDGMSYIGNASVDLTRVTIFTGSSGKGLGSVPGIGILLYNEFFDQVSTVKYIDLRYYREKQNVPFTISTVQVKALGISSRERLVEKNFLRIRLLREYIEKRVAQSKFVSLEKPDADFVAFFSLQIHPSLSSRRVGEYLESKDIFLSFRTLYLTSKNCIEISLLDMHTGECELEILFNTIESYGEK